MLFYMWSCEGRLMMDLEKKFFLKNHARWKRRLSFGLWTEISVWHYAFFLLSCFSFPDYGGSSAMKYQTYNPSFGSKSSYGYSGSRTLVSTTESSHISRKYSINHEKCPTSLTLCWHHKWLRMQQVWYFTVGWDGIRAGFSSPPSRFLHIWWRNRCLSFLMCLHFFI